MFRLTDNVLDQLDAVLDTVVADLDLTKRDDEDPVASVAGADVYIQGAHWFAHSDGRFYRGGAGVQPAGRRGRHHDVHRCGHSG